MVKSESVSSTGLLGICRMRVVCVFYCRLIFHLHFWQNDGIIYLILRQELCESRGGRPGLPSLISLWLLLLLLLCVRKGTLNQPSGKHAVRAKTDMCNRRGPGITAEQFTQSSTVQLQTRRRCGLWSHTSTPGHCVHVASISVDHMKGE